MSNARNEKEKKKKGGVGGGVVVVEDFVWFGVGRQVAAVGICCRRVRVVPSSTVIPLCRAWAVVVRLTWRTKRTPTNKQTNKQKERRQEIKERTNKNKEGSLLFIPFPLFSFPLRSLLFLFYFFFFILILFHFLFIGWGLGVWGFEPTHGQRRERVVGRLLQEA
jgi:hypothetical protein